MKKGGDIRVCVDFKYLNTQINIEKYPLPKEKVYHLFILRSEQS